MHKIKAKMYLFCGEKQNFDSPFQENVNVIIIAWFVIML